MSIHMEDNEPRTKNNNLFFAGFFEKSVTKNVFQIYRIKNSRVRIISSDVSVCLCVRPAWSRDALAGKGCHICHHR